MPRWAGQLLVVAIHGVALSGGQGELRNYEQTINAIALTLTSQDLVKENGRKTENINLRS